MKSSIRPRPWLPRKSAFAGFRFPADVIVFAVRCYLRFNLSYRNVEELLVERYANNPIEADHSQLKHRLRPMRGLQTDQTAQVIIAGHAFMQNVRADTTNSPSMPHPLGGSLLRLPNSPKRSNLEP